MKISLRFAPKKKISGNLAFFQECKENINPKKFPWYGSIII
jgi:hypothetical protein